MSVALSIKKKTSYKYYKWIEKINCNYYLKKNIKK